MLWFFIALCVGIAWGWAFSEGAFDNKKEVDKLDLLGAHFYYVYLPVLGHIEALARHYNNLRYIGDYGELLEEDWERELRYFIKTVIMPRLNNLDVINSYILDGHAVLALSKAAFQKGQEKGKVVKGGTLAHLLPELLELPERHGDLQMMERALSAAEQFGFGEIHFALVKVPDVKQREYLYLDEAVYNFVENRLFVLLKLFLRDLFELCPDIVHSEDVKVASDYERLIATELRKLGFVAQTTKASGDQGADVLASKNGVSFAIQCKMYSKPVGNKAVQEANAGRDFYRKNYGVVVARAGFTKSARQAAQACGIILLNDKQLEKLLDYTK